MNQEVYQIYEYAICKYDLTMIIVTKDSILFMFGDLYSLYAEFSAFTYSRELLSFKFIN